MLDVIVDETANYAVLKLLELEKSHSGIKDIQQSVPLFALYLLVSFIPLILFCFARHRQGITRKPH